MTTTTSGTYLTRDDGRPAVRLTRTYARPITRVWAYVSDFAELKRWFPSAFEAEELVPGATIRFSGDPNMPESTGTVLAADAPRHLSFSWGGDELHLDLTPVDGGGTRLTLTDVLESADTAARNAAGWEVCLGALDAADRGEPVAGPHAGASAPWKELYDAYLAAGFPSGAPVPGLDDRT
ncbi:SRPBCC family protein [Streptomyces sp. SID14478]|uniref:SRPBCC family protein n=1 Tax=Streptomyces sp. SID14478 TaxID=2706073 RepID=UPI0013D8EB91|nr:SRPBCC family protein [Streptomyces sp. SID14478]NEB77943.1 SRPBCC family protein [Streptomyces sp. SID14478]